MKELPRNTSNYSFTWLLAFIETATVSGNALWNALALSANGSVVVALNGSGDVRKMDRQRNSFMVNEFSPASLFSPLNTHPFVFFPCLCPKWMRFLA